VVAHHTVKSTHFVNQELSVAQAAQAVALQKEHVWPAAWAVIVLP
jgi:hypothetical protein